MEPENQNVETDNSNTEEQSEVSVPNIEERSVGAIIGTIIIVVLIVAGGIYFFTTRKSPTVTPPPTPEEILQTQDATTTALEQQSTSDTVSDIQTDLNNTDLGGIDAEMNAINTELQAQ